VSGRRTGLPAWGDAERLRLQIARKQAGHTEATCAEILRSEFGVGAASQPDVSRWESGAIAVPQCVSGLLAYCDAYGPNAAKMHADPEAQSTSQVATRSTGGHEPRAASFGEEAESFERLAAEAAGEPLLGASQLELVRGMSRRLEHGPPLTPEDRATYLDQLRILRVPHAG
jgi:hypothetical protein